MKHNQNLQQADERVRQTMHELVAAITDRRELEPYLAPDPNRDVLVPVSTISLIDGTRSVYNAIIFRSVQCSREAINIMRQIFGALFANPDIEEAAPAKNFEAVAFGQ
jgi:hypothetical protein